MELRYEHDRWAGVHRFTLELSWEELARAREEGAVIVREGGDRRSLADHLLALERVARGRGVEYDGAVSEPPTSEPTP